MLEFSKGNYKNIYTSQVKKISKENTEIKNLETKAAKIKIS